MSHSYRKPVNLLAALFAGAVLALTASAASACSVPVFRYALEHWQPDPYIAVVFHRGELTAKQQSLVDQLQPAADDGRPLANLIVKSVDLDQQQSDVVLKLWKQHETETLPLLSLQTPPKHGPPQTAWFGELTQDNVARLMDSPARRQIRKKLLDGDSVVWVFLNSGKQAEDDAAFQLLNDELARLQGVIELPAIEEQDLDDLSVDPTALKIAFSSIRIGRDDEQEQALIDMLLRVEGDLLEEPYVNQPMAFPVFARGRALYALVGDGITPETIEDASRFLTGACQCTVKAQNPGVDLMMNVDWEQFVEPALPYDDAPPTLAGLTSFAAPRSEDSNSSGSLPPLSDEDRSPAATNGDQAEPALAAVDASAPVATAEPVEQSETKSADSIESPETMQTQAGSSPPGDESLVQSITLFLGLICAGVIAVTLIVVTRK